MEQQRGQPTYKAYLWRTKYRGNLWEVLRVWCQGSQKEVPKSFEKNVNSDDPWIKITEMKTILIWW